MKIALCSSFVPFIHGGARNIVDSLQIMLEEQGHKVEKVYLPQIDAPDLLFQQMMAYRWVDLESADRIICLRPQAHIISHPQKILWFIHHLRFFYDLWDSPYRGFPDDTKHQGIRHSLHDVDKASLLEAKKIFTISKVVSQRLKKYNQIDSEVLYYPLLQAEQFHCSGVNDDIVCVSRLEQHKRQHLLIEAMRYTKTPVRLRLSGVSSNPSYALDLAEKIEKWGLSQKVIFDNRWISDQEKIDILASCLATTYIPFDEDSFGYTSLESSYSRKPLITTTDSGGVTELVVDGSTGYVVDPEPQALADAMDKMYWQRKKTIEMGENAYGHLSQLTISWDQVLNRLLT